MARRSDFYALVAIFLMVALGLGVMCLNINGVLDDITAVLGIVVPGLLIVAAARFGGRQESEYY
jgi:hypothetical protein